MLVLSRKAGESIKIDGGIEVRILDVLGDSVKIGIEAPSDVAIWREELYNEVAASNRKAMEWDIPSGFLGKTLSKLNKKGSRDD